LANLSYLTLTRSSRWQECDESAWNSANAGVDHADDTSNGTRDCIVCSDTKSFAEFPYSTITDSRTHVPQTCLFCLSTHIRTEMDSRVWNNQTIRCPECREPLGYHDVQQYADPETLALQVLD